MSFLIVGNKGITCLGKITSKRIIMPHMFHHPMNKLNDGLNLLSEFLVWNPENSDIGYSRVGYQHVLRLLRINVDTA